MTSGGKGAQGQAEARDRRAASCALGVGLLHAMKGCEPAVWEFMLASSAGGSVSVAGNIKVRSSCEVEVGS